MRPLLHHARGTLRPAMSCLWLAACSGTASVPAMDLGDNDLRFGDVARLDRSAGIDFAPDGAAEGGPADEDSAGDGPSDPGPLVIYLSPTGDDARDGLSQPDAILTLQRAQAILAALDPDRDVEIRIAPGTYYGQTVVWTFTMPDHQIKLMTLAGDKDRPVFDGCTKAAAAAADCPGGTWFKLDHSGGEETNLHFWYIAVMRYQTAISFNGARETEATSNGSNRIYGCHFSQIGNLFNPAVAPSTAAVRLVNSDDNEIANSHFVDIVNTTSAALLHALYVAHLSDRNRILRNRFYNTSGDPIRLRDFSNHNQINDNKLIKTGAAGYSDWYCDHEVRTDCTKTNVECPSWENEFRDNLLDGSYSCGSMQTFVYFQDATTAGCSPVTAGAVRLHTSGNTKTAVPCTNQ